MNLQIKGIYFYVWVAILFSAGSISMFFIINLILARKISSKVIIFSIVSLGILGGLTYILWDFDYSLAIINTRGQDVIGNITLTNSRGEVVAQTIDNELDISLQKGSYTLIIKSRGYEQNESSIVNTIGFKQNNDITQIVILKPKYINLSQFYFTEPTHTIKLSPVIHVIGSNILNEQVNQTLGKESALMYGEYSVELADENFELETNFQGDTFNEGYKIVLNPNDRFIVLTSKEVSHITNYINDYLSLNENLHSNDQGLPKQFYLYQRDQVISLGKMIFLFCEQQAYSKNRIENPLYFIPGDMKFKFSEPAKNTTECYFLALDGKIPQTIGNNSLQQEIYKELTKNPDNFYYPISELNSEKRNLEISFTFDIESGRYVPRNNKPAISPCESKDYSLGLEKNELLCDNPRLVAWMSPRGGKITYLDYPYPQVSGILGFREILSYSERYGIPTTNFIVKKDILAFEQLEPELIERTKKLIENGLFEVGAHTRYHTELGSVDISIAKHEVKESKKFLEAYFNTTVYGFRSPYLSKIGTKKTHEEVLMGIGYTYYSDAGEYSNEGIAHKPWNSYEFGHDYFSLKTASDVKKLMSKRSYIITLDHPWNIAYTHEDIIYETPETPDNLRTNVLTAISNGAISVMAKDIIIKN
jgi:peptidoglycan/xylan/chitin deacetylase (PgdA/CDA1 family)